MKKANLFMTVLAAAIVLAGMLFFSAQLVSAKGPFSKVTISGGELPVAVEVTDTDLLQFFSFSNFPNAATSAPSVGEGYVVTRYYQNADGSFDAWDTLHYYPGSAGSSGYVFYDGLVDGSSMYDGKWYIANPEVDAAFQDILASQQPAPTNNVLLSQVLIAVELGLAGLAIFISIGTKLKMRKSLTSPKILR